MDSSLDQVRAFLRSLPWGSTVRLLGRGIDVHVEALAHEFRLDVEWYRIRVLAGMTRDDLDSAWEAAVAGFARGADRVVCVFGPWAGHEALPILQELRVVPEFRTPAVP